jgi:hypothetical protein
LSLSFGGSLDLYSPSPKSTVQAIFDLWDWERHRRLADAVDYRGGPRAYLREVTELRRIVTEQQDITCILMTMFDYPPAGPEFQFDRPVDDMTRNSAIRAAATERQPYQGRTLLLDLNEEMTNRASSLRQDGVDVVLADGIHPNVWANAHHRRNPEGGRLQTVAHSCRYRRLDRACELERSALRLDALLTQARGTVRQALSASVGERRGRSSVPCNRVLRISGPSRRTAGRRDHHSDGHNGRRSAADHRTCRARASCR